MSEQGGIPSTQRRQFFKQLFERTSLIPFFAFIGLGADSISSSCYGPEEAFLSLGNYHHLIVFVGLMAIITIWTISSSYSQLIGIFPHGGGGYLVASKLLSANCGLIAGCSLLVDYILTITISISSGVDALFSFLPIALITWKLPLKICALGSMMFLNIRGIKESVFPWIPVFFLFGITHLAAFIWAFWSHYNNLPAVYHGIHLEVEELAGSIGMWGVLLMLLKSYSVGAGTFTGIEAVSNGMNIFRAPRVKNARKTMFYMSTALAVTVFGLMLSFLLYRVTPVAGKTLNGVLLDAISAEMPYGIGHLFSPLALFSEAAILIMAAQSGFLAGPRILANMAADRWLPNKFTNLSDYFVMRHGIFLITGGCLALMIYTAGNVAHLVILYSLAVFITYSLSQLGMIIHWAKERMYHRTWLKGLILNGVGFCLTSGILVSLILLKFLDGAWLTLAVIAILVCICHTIKRYYNNFSELLNKLPSEITARTPSLLPEGHLDRTVHTAVFFVSGKRPLALHSINEAIKLFGNSIEHFVFLQVGIIDAGIFKGESELKHLEDYTRLESEKLVHHMQQLGYSAESQIAIGLDIGDEISKLAKEVRIRHPSSIFFGGQLILPQEYLLSHVMHNQTLFIIQRRIFDLGFPFVTIPVYLAEKPS